MSDPPIDASADGSRLVRLTGIALISTAVLACSTPPEGSTAEGRQDDCCAYFEPLDSAVPTNCESDECKVIWCSAARVKNKTCGDNKYELRVDPSSGQSGTVVWVWFGDREVAEVQIEFSYAQYEGNPASKDLADAALQVEGSTKSEFDRFDCPTRRFDEVVVLNRTYSAANVECFDETYSFVPEPHHRSVFFRFQKNTGGAGTVLGVDDVRISVRAPASTSGLGP